MCVDYSVVVMLPAFNTHYRGRGHENHSAALYLRSMSFGITCTHTCYQCRQINVRVRSIENGNKSEVTEDNGMAIQSDLYSKRHTAGNQTRAHTHTHRWSKFDFEPAPQTTCIVYRIINLHKIVVSLKYLFDVVARFHSD